VQPSEWWSQSDEGAEALFDALRQQGVDVGSLLQGAGQAGLSGIRKFKGPKAGKGRGGPTAAEMRWARSTLDSASYDFDFGDSGSSRTPYGDSASTFGINDSIGGVLNAEAERLGQIQEAAAQRKQTLVESVFGPIEQIDLTMTALQGLGGAWTAMSAGVAAGYGAIVDGTEDWGKAMKTAIADSLKATGTQLMVEALKETGLGFASLALGPIGGVSAGAHFKAAAILGGAAVLAGAAAHGLGTSGSQSAAASGAASGARSYASGGGSGSTPPQEPTRIIVYADAFAEDSERGKRLIAEKIVARAYGSGPTENN
jgi:hypothetical protein